MNFCLGTVQWGINYGINNKSGITSELEVNKILDHAHLAGVKKIDTASIYGISEKLIGNYLKNNPSNKFEISSKISYSDLSLENQVENSLKNLCTRKLDKLIFHSFQNYKKFRPQIEKFVSSNKGVLFNDIGISLYTNDEIDFILNEDIIENIQIPFNIFDNFKIRGDVIKKILLCEKKIDVRSIFLQGLFFKDENALPKILKPFTSPLKELKNISESYGLSITELAIGYIKLFNSFDSILIGVESLNQLKNNLSCSKVQLSEEIKNKLESIKLIDKSLLNPSKWEQ